jgi:4-oxalocrotonate tautomerase
MPEVIIELIEGHPVEQKRALLREVTDAVVRVCDVPPDAVIVTIREAPPTNKSKGGIPFSDR